MITVFEAWDSNTKQKELKFLWLPFSSGAFESVPSTENKQKSHWAINYTWILNISIGPIFKHWDPDGGPKFQGRRSSMRGALLKEVAHWEQVLRFNGHTTFCDLLVLSVSATCKVKSPRCKPQPPCSLCGHVILTMMICPQTLTECYCFLG